MCSAHRDACGVGTKHQGQISNLLSESYSAPSYKKGEGEAHLELAHSLPHLFMYHFLIISVDHLLGYTIKEVTHSCDDHLDILLIGNPDCDSEEQQKHHMAIMSFVASHLQIRH
jgi:hypothetical protein